MAPEAPLPQRKSPRLEGYDYSQEGAYFATVCTQHRLCLFGQVADGQIQLNRAGQMIAVWWSRLPVKFADIDVDLHIVMTNHFHGIVVISRGGVGKAQRGLPAQTNPNQITENAGHHMGWPLPKTSLFDAMGWFKTMTTNAYIRGVREQRWRPVPGKFRQRSYHDRIIRDDRELDRLRKYTLYNAARWQADTFFVTEIWS